MLCPSIGKSQSGMLEPASINTRMRNLINIINEFVLPDSEDGDGDRNDPILVYDIIWDSDEEGLPSRVTVTMDELDDVNFPSEHDGDLFSRIGDWLSENISGSLSNFAYRKL